MSFPRYPKYRTTGVADLGELPEHWTITHIKRTGKLKGGAGFPHDKQGLEGEELSFHKVNALAKADANGRLLPSDNTISRETAQSLGAFIFPPRTIVFAKVGAALLLGRIRMLSHEACIDNNMMGIVPGSSVSCEYLRNAMALVRFDVLANPGAVPSINESQIGNVVLALPPLSEQFALAAFLESETAKIDALIAEQQRLMELLQEKRKAVISHAVTKGLNPNAPMKRSGVEWLGEVPAHWEVRRMKHLVRRFEQGWSPQCESYPADPEREWGVLKVGAVNGGVFDPFENKALPADLERIESLTVSKGDLLISRANTRELVGSAAVATRDYPTLMICDKIYRARLHDDRCLPGFAASYLGSSTVRGQIELAATGASDSMLNIAQAAVLDLPVPTPPIDEQGAICEAIIGRSQVLEVLAGEAASAIALLQERRAALITAAVTGQIDVRASAA